MLYVLVIGVWCMIVVLRSSVIFVMVLVTVEKGEEREIYRLDLLSLQISVLSLRLIA